MQISHTVLLVFYYFSDLCTFEFPKRKFPTAAYLFLYLLRLRPSKTIILQKKAIFLGNFSKISFKKRIFLVKNFYKIYSLGKNSVIVSKFSLIYYNLGDPNTILLISY